ncbi:MULTISPECIES: polysaccharide biosynthesis/export family protein [Hymenobacter]|uniref:Polysaccharide export protein n=1 Tax=Hymenobacter jejuensis TaxID=2502781 RepID=A0A5B7ZVK0_9BACT|nr:MULTISPECIES: polysaccharide biosynthesis/export family protein [Hymenobacter]MBC6988811.1 polysaccharide biosynthesis/export family protein [Hymenobacter sp. BT491]QDA58877.1 polysaccharide export protein [Hymenobacter jejuensis]
MSHYRLLIFLLLASFTSCIPSKDISYLQGQKYSLNKASEVSNQRPEYHLQANDILNIAVQSAQPELSRVFSLTESTSPFGTSDPGATYLNGYVIDNNGNITLPTAGKLPVQGLTLLQAQDVVQKAVNNYMRGTTVIVKLVNFKITVLGEVRNPGAYYIQNPSTNLLQGLGLAGDLTTLGNRRNVKLIRQTPTGSEVTLIDLTRADLLTSNYYYLLPNDVLYVEPSKAVTQRGNLTNLGIVFSGITTIVLLLNYFGVK